MQTGFEVRLHHLAFTLRGTEVGRVHDELFSLWGRDFAEAKAGMLGYEHQRVSGPVRLLYSERRPELHVIFPGEACDMLGGQKCEELLSYVRERGGKVTRCDLAGDDYNRVVSPADVREAVKAGLCFSHADRWRWYENDEGGTTFYLGSASSRQQLKVYDKEIESEGLTPSSRWELEVRDEAAETLVEQLATLPWGEVFASRLVQLVDFRDREEGDRSENCARSPWFEALVGQARKAVAYLPQAARTLGQVQGWFEKQCAPLAAVLMKKGGFDWFQRTLKAGEAHWGTRHVALLAAT